MQSSAALSALPEGDLPASDACSDYPLVLDLDGTLLRTDLLLEAALQYAKKSPHTAFLLVWWFRHWRRTHRLRRAAEAGADARARIEATDHDVPTAT